VATETRPRLCPLFVEYSFIRCPHDESLWCLVSCAISVNFETQPSVRKQLCARALRFGSRRNTVININGRNDGRVSIGIYWIQRDSLFDSFVRKTFFVARTTIVRRTYETRPYISRRRFAFSVVVCPIRALRYVPVRDYHRHVSRP